ncbi:MAG: hypothetical protein EXQ90_03165 [Rhodospirillales bacterium]|nr:hypothetical protein [Rhodospirillales bacterium]
MMPTSTTPPLPGMELLKGAIDSHVHCCPHINARTVTVFDAVRHAAAAGLRGVGLLDLFANSSGLAALANRELGHLGVDVFGGIVLEPYAGGVSARAVEVALDMGYGSGSGARFVSLPCHATRMMARAERRSPAFVESCLEIPLKGELPDPLPEILDRIAARDVVFNTGHITAAEAVRAVEAAKARGIQRILCPASYYTADDVRELVRLGAYVEFAFFVMSHATQLGMTMSDHEKHRYTQVPLDQVITNIQAVGPDHVVLSSDSGSFVLAPPVEAFREWLVLVSGSGIDRAAIDRMANQNPAWLFKVGAVGAV